MVGDDQVGGAGAADRVLDEAAPPVRAGAVDALAAAVGQRGDQRAAVQFRQPARQVAALDVAVVGRQRPAGDQAQRDHLLVHEAGGGVADRFLQVQQAEVVLPALAHDDAAAAFGRVGDQTRSSSLSIWRCRWRVKVLIQTAPLFFSAQTLAGAR